MAEVLTRIDPDDSIEKFNAERQQVGSINYSPDYKSKKRKVGDVIGTAKIVYGGRIKAPPIEDDREPEEIDRERLEREVIEAAKAEIVAADEYEKHLVMANWERSVETRQARQNAVRGLIDFESSQQQIKK